MSEFHSQRQEYSPHDYGALANTLPDCTEETYYVTTAIAYTNGNPHIGHAYEFLTTDILARYQRVLGKRTFFLTGTDEHGQKVAASAEKAGLTPMDHCTKYVQAFKELNRQLCVTYSDFIRTTDPYHEQTSQRLWEKCAAVGDIYLDSYEGWYNEREEVFVTQAEAEAANFLDVGSGLPLKRVTEESYFFRMSKYCDQLLSFIHQNPDFIQPEQYRNGIVTRLEKEGLKDLSISRTSFTWGIPVPKGFDPKHVMYVWFDALTNYVSGVHGLDADHPLAGYWPANHHIIGKDIVWFHCVIWPCMLMSANVPLPKSVYCHGFVNAADGRKMSKSYNNTIDPFEVLTRFPVDTLRYYCCSSAPYGSDLNFSEEALIGMHNSELADILGNLVNRVLNLTKKFCDGVVPDVTHDSQYPEPFQLQELKDAIKTDVDKCSIHTAIFKAMEAARATNKYLTEAEPWKMKGDENAIRRQAIVRTSLEAVYAFIHFLAPVIPVAAQKVFDCLNTDPKSVQHLKNDFYNLTPGTPITVGEILFQKIITEAPAAAEQQPVKKEEKKSAGEKKDKKEKSGSGEKTEKAPAEEEGVLNPSKLEIKVGMIVRCWNHPESEKLLCEEIDLGEGQNRTIASGLRAHYTAEEMQGQKVLVLANLKERPMAGFKSQGMVLCAIGEGHSTVKLVHPPASAKVGDRVEIGDFRGEPAPASQVAKKKIFETLAPFFKTDSHGVATWNNLPFTINGEQCIPTLPDSVIS